MPHLDEEQDVQYFGLPLAVLLPQHQDVQQAAPHPLTQLGQPGLQLGHRVHAALAVLHHLREQQAEGTHTHLGFGSAERPLQNRGLASGEASLHYLRGEDRLETKAHQASRLRQQTHSKTIYKKNTRKYFLYMPKHCT